jgi:hypothetical protein
MPGTRRTPLARSHTPLITPQVVELYRRALRLRKQAHLSEADRELAIDAERDVDRALGLKLWDDSVFEDFMFVSDEPPAYLRESRDANAVEGWYHVRELRRQLKEADRELRRQERAARRAKAAARQAGAEPSPPSVQPPSPTA